MSTSPSSAGSSPARTRNSVDLPTPFAPTSPTCWAGVILNDTSANSRSPPGCAYARLETTTCDIAVQPREHASGLVASVRGLVDTYQNPVYGPMADPMALREPGGYFVYGTGDRFPVAHSTDLVHWTRIGTAMVRRPHWVPQSGEWNPWAPSVIRRDTARAGTDYVMYYSGLNSSLSPPANCIGVATASSPDGPFTD